MCGAVLRRATGKDRSYGCKAPFLEQLGTSQNCPDSFPPQRWGHLCAETGEVFLDAQCLCESYPRREGFPSRIVGVSWTTRQLCFRQHYAADVARRVTSGWAVTRQEPEPSTSQSLFCREHKGDVISEPFRTLSTSPR